MASEADMLTNEEFASLLTVGNAAVNSSAPMIPAAHRARLIALGYMVDLAGRLRMTTQDVYGYMLGSSSTERPERLTMATKIKEHTCPACKGTGFPVVAQPVQPGRKIYPVKCKACDGKGKITEADRGGSWQSCGLKYELAAAGNQK